MIHLVTTAQGLTRAKSWLESDDLVVLLGSAKANIRTTLELVCPIRVLRLPDTIIDEAEADISVSALIQLLASAKTRTWS